jgi:hypothetical protein
VLLSNTVKEVKADNRGHPRWPTRLTHLVAVVPASSCFGKGKWRFNGCGAVYQWTMKNVSYSRKNEDNGDWNNNPVSFPGSLFPTEPPLPDALS